MIRHSRQPSLLLTGWPKLALTVIVLLLGAPSCGGREAGADVTLVLGAYTTPREAYRGAIIPAFQRYWRERTGQVVEFKESYLGSGAQSRAIVTGFEADVAALSLEADITRIAEKGLITHDWRAAPHGGIVSTSIVVFAVRRGNPLNIRDWSDLAIPGRNILTPDPRTSGGAMWNICALYGAAFRGFVEGVPSGDRAAATEFMKRVIGNVSIMDKGARESITNFERGIGDVAITYENEVRVGQASGQDYEYVVPRSTLLIQNPAALIDVNVDRHGTRRAAEAFLDFLNGGEAQRALAHYGLRPVDETVASEVADQFPGVEDLWRIDFLGGWNRVLPDFFGPEGLYTRLYQEMHASR